MTLTEHDLSRLQASLENILQVVKDCRKPMKVVQPVWKSRQEYLEALKNEDKLPERLYNFTFKDVYISISYRNNTNQYHLICKNFYSKVLDQFKTFRSESWIISDSLDYTKMVFSDVIQDFFECTILKDGLF